MLLFRATVLVRGVDDMKYHVNAVALLFLATPMASAHAVPVTFSASAADAAGLQATVDAFRSDLGTLNPNVAGSAGSGRREINWDGVPDASAAPNGLASNF